MTGPYENTCEQLWCLWLTRQALLVDTASNLLQSRKHGADIPKTSPN